MSMRPIDPDDDAERLMQDAIRVVDRVNQALGQMPLSPAALRRETPDLYALQQLAQTYAERTLTKADWIALHEYVAQLAVAEGAQSRWQWQALDLKAFALNDYLADHPDAGDALLHELVAVTRQGAAHHLHDLYRAHRRDWLREIRNRFDRDGTFDRLCERVASRREHAGSACPRTS